MRSNVQMDFSRRVSPRELPELMDGDCTYEEFRDCLLSLQKVNRWLLGYRPTLAWLKRLGHHMPQPAHIIDIGCGGGDLLRRIGAWAQGEGMAVHLTGIDLNPYAARAAAEFTPKAVVATWITGNALTYRSDEPVDIVVTSLTAHHMEDAEIVALLRWMEDNAKVGWFINDLARSELACRAFEWIARWARWHRFVQHDGPVSFRRAFRKEDWVRLLRVADIPRELVTLEHWRPGRLCVGRRK